MNLYIMNTIKFMGNCNGFFIAVIFSFLLLSVVSCSTEDPQTDNLSQPALEVSEPVDRDFQDIKNSGILRMITHYSTNTYFLNQGMEAGFEYDLVKEFAKEHDLAVEVVIVGAEDNPFELLNQGEGDVIAANYTITPERSEVANFTRLYNLVDQIIVYSADISDPPQSLHELADRGIPVHVQKNSAYHFRLMKLREEGIHLNLQVVTEGLETETALMQVSNGTFQATVSDDNMFYATNRYLKGLQPGPVISESDSIAWAVRSNAADLENHMNRFLYKHFRITDDRDAPRRSAFLNILRKKYFNSTQQIAGHQLTNWNEQSLGMISPYDELVKSVADSVGLDWLMLTAIIAQESGFDPASKSWAGAVGLMQVMPQFVETPYEELFDPVQNIYQGAQIIKEHLDHYSYMDEHNQRAFALATYNVGMGHMADARRIAIDQNKNPNDWNDVSDSLVRLMQRRYYRDARYGFARGIEPVRYVEEVSNRYRTYHAVIALAEQQQQSGYTNLLMHGFIQTP